MESTNSSNNTKSLKNAVLLAISFRKLIVALLMVLKNSKNSIISVIVLAFIFVLNNYKYHIDKVKTELKNEIGEIWNMTEGVFQTIAGQQIAAENNAASNQR